VRVQVRTSEPAGAIGPLRPDTLLAPDASEDAGVAAAVALLRAPVRAGRPAAPDVASAPPAVARAEARYAERALPDSARRVLAAYRWWAAVQYFYPNKHLTGEDWNAVLPAAIARLEQAGDSTAYALAVAEMVAHIHDSHGRVESAALDAYRGTAGPPVRVRVIEGRPIVTAVLDSTAGVAVGDEIVAVDGAPAAARLARYTRTYAASTPWAGTRNAANTFLNGAEGSTALLAVRDGTGRRREVRLARRARTRPRA
jgi:hypothetical protein